MTRIRPISVGGFARWTGLAVPMLMALISCTQLAEKLPKQSVEVVPPNAAETVETVEPEVRSGPVKVGLLLPLSGQMSSLAADMLSAAQMALFDLPPHDFVLLPRDTGGDPARAKSAAHALISSGADVILGPLLASSTQSVRMAVRETAGLAAPASTASTQPAGSQSSVKELVQNTLGLESPADLEGSGSTPPPQDQTAAPIEKTVETEPLKVVSFSSDSNIAGNGVYIIGFRPEEQVERIVTYAVDQGLPRIAFLAPDDAYGAVTLRGYRTGLEQSATLSRERFALYPPEAPDQSDAVRQVSNFAARAAEIDAQRKLLEVRGDAAAKLALQALEGVDTQTPPPFDAIVIADGDNRLRSVAALLDFFDVARTDVRMLGTMRWLDDPSVLDEPNLDRAWVAAVDQALKYEFDRKFEQRLGRQPSLLAQLAYDAVALAVLIGSEDRTYPHELLTDPEGFIGSGGIFRFREDGLSEHGLSVLEVGEGASRVEIDQAPKRFPGDFAAGL